MKKVFVVFMLMMVIPAVSGCFAAELPLTESIARFKANEDRFNTFINSSGYYTTSGSEQVKTVPQYMSDMTTAGLRYETVALMEADTGQANGAHCLVYDAVDPADNGYYMWTTGSPGAWSYLGWFPSEAIDLPLTTHANETGIIYKDTTRFIHDFNYGNNGTVTTVGHNIFLGEDAGNLTMGSTATSADESSYNVGIGYHVLTSVGLGNYNTGIGYSSLSKLDSGSLNTMIGALAGSKISTGSQNIGIGYGALSTASTSSGSIGIGYASLYANTASNNTAIGNQSLRYNTSGSTNLAIGHQALYSNTTASSNTGIGYLSLYSTTTNSSNTAVGSSSLYLSTGTGNTAVGDSALTNIATGDYNVAIGYNAGRYVDAPDNNTDSTSCIFIGYGARPTAISHTNEIVIGSNAVGNGSNSVTIGNTSITKTILRANVGIGNTAPGYPLEVTGTTSTDGMIYAIVSKSTAYTATAADYTILVSGNTTITLPAASSNTGRVYVIKKTDTAGTTAIIDANSTETIDGDETVSLTTQYSFRMIQCTGTGWTIISRY